MMTLQEAKLLNAIKYFVKNTNNVGRTKLFKLLYFWDFRFFEKHGKSITDLQYFTYPFGPVPDKLYNEIKEDKLPSYLNDDLVFEDSQEFDEDNEFKPFKVLLRDKKIDMAVFTPYEEEALKEVAYIFKDATASEMTEASHIHNSPWSKTLKEKGRFQEIDYFLAKSESTPYDDEEIRERMFLRENLLHNDYD